MELKLIKVGNSVGVLLPKEVRVRLRLEAGDSVYLTETPHGYKLTPFDEKFASQMEVARRAMQKHRAALRELAK